MGANTSRTNMYLPGGGSSGTITPDESADIDDLNDNFKIIDKVIGSPVWTSSSKPSSVDRFDGMIVFESDTKQLAIFDESANIWVTVGGVRDKGTVATSDTPSSFDVGISMGSTSGSGWPASGMVLTIKKANNVIQQQVIASDNSGMWSRVSTDGTSWTSFNKQYPSIKVQSSQPSNPSTDDVWIY